jgi:ubiquitin-like domain-containing CTD phosphatase 1
LLTTFVPRIPPKLALFSGHDTTLMPILATLGGDVWAGAEWAPYASMILIEL